MNNKNIIKDALFETLTNFNVVGRLREPIDLHKAFTKELAKHLPNNFNIIHTAIIESPYECDERFAGCLKVTANNGKTYKAGTYYNRAGFNFNIDEVE